MTAPEWFLERLHADNHGRLRLRWSHQHHEWQIEAKRERGAIISTYVSEYDDARIRARDGYDIIAAVRPGDRMPCRRCRTTVRVPCFEFGETKCERCGCRMRASYWPLGEALLEHLRYIDPFRGGHERIFADAERANAEREKSNQRAFSGHIQDEARDWAIDSFPHAAWDASRAKAWDHTEDQT